MRLGRARSALWTVLFGLMAGCAPTPAPPPTPTVGAPADFPADWYEAAIDGSVFRVDPTDSLLELRVYRDGPLARFGHNHVITGAIEGRVFLANDFARSRADLYVSVLDLVVDDPVARAAAGAPFAAEVDPDSVQGTLGNLLGPSVLHAAEYPHLKAHLQPIAGSDRTMMSLYVKDHVLPVPLSINWRIDNLQLRAEATFEVRQSALGITPFSVMGGGLRVRDGIDVRVQVHAAMVD